MPGMVGLVAGDRGMLSQINNLKKMGFCRTIIILFISILFIAPGAGALKMLSGDQVSVDSPVDDDIFAAGGSIDINAPVASAVIAGGNININAPVDGDVFVAGGQISINSDVKGKIVAAGGNIDVKGSAKNIVISGGNINIHSSAVISRDAVITGGSVNNAGRINGNLTVRSENFQNTGSAGVVDFKKSEVSKSIQAAIGVFRILFTVGFLILGIVLIKLFPAQFFKVEEEMMKSTIVKTVAGFVFIFVAAVLIILIAVTVIGLPIAAISGMLFIIALMLSTSFVSFAVGRKVVDLLKFKTSDILIFIIGFIILNIIFLIPFIGGLILIIAVSLGFGAICYSVSGNWKRMTTVK